MSWDSIKEKASKYTKIPAGKSVRVHLLSEPDEKVVHFIGGKYEPCLESDCDRCRQKEERIDRFAMSVFNMEMKVAQVFEGTIPTLMKIKNIREAYNKNTDSLDFIISRSTGSPAKYEVISVPTQFKPEMLKKDSGVIEDVPF